MTLNVIETSLSFTSWCGVMEGERGPVFLFYLPLVVGYCAAALTACRRSSANLVCQACQALFFHQSLGLVILQQQLRISPSSLSKIHAATCVPQPSKPTLLAWLLDKKNWWIAVKQALDVACFHHQRAALVHLTWPEEAKKKRLPVSSWVTLFGQSYWF